jgi:hypothetical protein
LFEVWENMELRSNEPKIERVNGQAVIHRAPMRVQRAAHPNRTGLPDRLKANARA